jgi:hypothetical protein
LDVVAGFLKGGLGAVHGGLDYIEDETVRGSSGCSSRNSAPFFRIGAPPLYASSFIGCASKQLEPRSGLDDYRIQVSQAIDGTQIGISTGLSTLLNSYVNLNESAAKLFTKIERVLLCAMQSVGRALPSFASGPGSLVPPVNRAALVRDVSRRTDGLLSALGDVA